MADDVEKPDLEAGILTKNYSFKALHIPTLVVDQRGLLCSISRIKGNWRETKSTIQTVIAA
jgi:hypothetical protein